MSVATDIAGLPPATRERLKVSAAAWTTVGGCLSAWFCVPPFSMLYFMFSVPLGLMAGAVIGIPGAMVLDRWIHRHHDPPSDPEAFLATLQAIGMTGGLAGCTFAAWGWIASVELFGSTGAWNLSIVAIFVAFVTVAGGGVALSGRWVGRRLAIRYLRAWGLDIPPSWFRRQRQRIRR